MKHKIIILLWSLWSMPASGQIDLGEHHHVTFDGVPSTKYDVSSGHLKASVKQSSSLILVPFAKPRSVSQVSYRWKSTGLPAANRDVTDKTGDDHVWRVGILLKGEAPLVPFFAPGWVKALRDHMRLPTSEALYVVPAEGVTAGRRWASPYSDDLKFVAVKSQKTASGLKVVSWKSKKPYQVVGLWIMSDGDNTKASFEAELHDLQIK